MQKNNFQFSIFNFQLITALLLLISSCTFSGKQNNTQAVESVVPIDSLFVPTGNAQLDSLLQLEAVAKQDTNLAELYNRIAYIYDKDNFEKATEYYWKLKHLSERLDWNKGRYLFAAYYGVLLCNEGLPDSALVIFAPGLELAKKENNEKWLVDLNYYTGETYRMKGWLETALNYYLEVESIIERTNHQRIFVDVYLGMSDIYRSIHLLDKAIEYGEKAVALIAEHQIILSSLATAYSMSYQYEKGNEYYEKALEISIEQNDIYSIEYICLQLADNYRQLFDLDKYEMYLNKVLEICGSVDNMYFDFLYMGMLGQLEKMKGNFAKAEKYILQALEFAIQKQSLEYQKTCYSLLAELSLVQHKYRDNIRYEIEREKLNQAIALEASVRAITEMSAKYETAKKELEIENQKQVIAHQNMQHRMFAAGIAVCIVFLTLLWYMLRLRTRRNRALTEMNATKDKFFSIISHDLKNPALAQQNALQMLLENAEFWDANTLKAYCQKLLKSADGQVELLYNLLNWAQIQTGRMPFQPVPFDLVAELRKTAIPLISDMATRKGVELIPEIPENVLITGDVNMLTTVVRNLLDNAVKFTHTGGSVTLKISQSTDTICAHNSAGQAEATTTHISISDTGIGMTEEQMQNLFRSNHQTSKRGTAGESGTGIGLVVCKELLEKHGSTLHIESKLNEGSCFRFEIR